MQYMNSTSKYIHIQRPAECPLSLSHCRFPSSCISLIFMLDVQNEFLKIVTRIHIQEGGN